MRPADLDRLIKRMQTQATASLDQRVYATLSEAASKDKSSFSVAIRPRIWRIIMRSRTTQVAAAAVVLIGIGVLARYWIGNPDIPSQQGLDHVAVRPTEPGTTRSYAQDQRLTAESALAGQLFAKADTPGLIDLLDSGLDQTKVKVAGYLGQIGDERAAPVLQRLADQWKGPVVDNPYQTAIQEIRQRARQKSQPGVDIAPPNEGSPPSSGSRPTTDPNASGRQDGQRPLTLAIHVVDKTTGAPIPDTTIQASIGAQRQTYTSDHEGSFSLDIGPSLPASVIVSAGKEGYVWQRVEYQDLRIEAFPKAVQFSLEKGTVIGGVVQDETGQPIPGAQVGFYISAQQQFLEPHVSVEFEDRSDGQGRWRCSNVPKALDRFTITLRHPDYADTSIAIPGDVSPEDLYAEKAVAVLRKGISVVGRVLDTKGRPIAGARLLANEDPLGRDWTVTDANGCFTFPHLMPVLKAFRTFLLTVQAGGFTPQQKELTIDQGVEPIEFVLEPGKNFTGRVVDCNGTPIQGASVTTEEWNYTRTLKWQSTTGQDGRFTWDSAPHDAIWIHILKEGYREWLREVTADDLEQTFVMRWPFKMKGSVIDGQTGEAVKRFKLTPGIQKNDAYGHLIWQTSDDWVKGFTEGRYEYTITSDGRAYAVQIEADGYIPTKSDFVDANQQDVTLDISLTKGWGPTGYVVDTEGRPVEGAEVFWEQRPFILNGQASDKDQRVYTKTDKHGRFSFNPLDQKCPLLALSDQGIGCISQVAANQEAVIVLQPWTRVMGDLHVGTRPAANKELSIENSRLFAGIIWTENKVTTDQSGRFLFPRICPGEFKLYNQIYEARPGQTIELHLGGMGRTVRGDLMIPGPSNQPLSPKLRLVSIHPAVPFELIPRPEGFDRMTYEEVDTWLKQFHEGEQGRAYPGSHSDLTVEMEGRSSFQVENVAPGRYVLCGRINHPVRVRADLLMVGPVARVWHEVDMPAITDTNQIDIPLDLGRIPLLKANLEPGDPAPPLVLPTFGPNPIRLSDYLGRVVLLCFYNGPNEERTSPVLSTLKALSRQYHDHPSFAMIGVFQSQQSPLLDKKALDERGLDWPHGFVEGPNSKAFVEYDVHSEPCLNILIGPDGIIQAVGIPMEGLADAVANALR